MGPPSRGAFTGRRYDHDDLRCDPGAEDQPRRDAQRNHTEDKYPNTCHRVHQDIGRDHASNCTACADSWDARVRYGGCVGKTGDHATGQVKSKKSQMPHIVFDIVAKDPKKQHV
jgi:hypothetical protein